MIVFPRTPTRARLKTFADRRYSYLRALEHELIPSIEIHGRTLDFGGGRNAEYVHLLAKGTTLESLNVDPRIEPTILHDANRPFPMVDATYDTIVSFNTLEHVLDDEQALQELVRILKPGGTMHLVVPFLYRVHGSPSDFHRHTAFGWEARLGQLGIPEDRTYIEPMMWGRLTTAFSFLENTRLRVLRKLPLWADLLVKGTDDHEYPLGYYIRAKKP